MRRLLRLPIATTGERLAVAMVLERGFTLSLSAVAEALVSAGLPKFKLPEELVIWDQPLPVNANGKVERKLLAAAVTGTSAAPGRPAGRRDLTGHRPEDRHREPVLVDAERDFQFQVRSPGPRWGILR